VSLTVHSVPNASGCVYSTPVESNEFNGISAANLKLGKLYFERISNYDKG